jgi:hypothetical protein
MKEILKIELQDIIETEVKILIAYFLINGY